MLYKADFKTNRGQGFAEIKLNKKINIKKKASWKEYFNELLDEYCQCGSLHGLRYIRDPSIPRPERFLWLGIVLTCLYTSWNVVLSMYSQGATHSFTLDINPQNTPIWDIPFPAVMVCSAYPVKRSVFDIAKEVNNLKYRQYSRMLCPNKLAFASEIFNDSLGEEFFEFIQEAAIPCQDLIVNCHWQGKRKDCCTLFKPFLTAFGLCYVFNSLPGEIKYKHFSPLPGAEINSNSNFKYWSLAKGYPLREGKRANLVRPRWSEFGGIQGGFSFDLVDFKEERQEICTGDIQGFQIAVYPPNESYETEEIIRIPPNEHSYIKLHPNLVLAEESLKSIEKNDRECLFDDEVTLDFFSHYSQPSCRMECYIEETLKICGCSIFSVKRMIKGFNYPYCNDSRYLCLNNQLSNLISTPRSKAKKTLNDKCLCVPSCSWLDYNYQTSFEQIITPNTLPPWAEGYNKSSEENFARVSVFFSLQSVSTIDRKRTSTLGNFLGSCGGLLSLFLGFSFMSLFEVVYFALIRPLNRVITLHLDNRKN